MRNKSLLANMPPGTILRRHKEAQNPLSRGLLAYKGLDSQLYAFILCKKKVTDPITQSVSVLDDRLIGEGMEKSVKIAYDFFSEKPYANLILFGDWTNNGQASFEKELKFGNVFAGMRGFSPSKPLAVHYYTKKSKDFEGSLDLKMGCFDPYHAGGTLLKFLFPEEESSPITAKTRYAFYMDIACALNSLEELKIVHGDFSWGNVLTEKDEITQEQKFYLKDFGFASKDDEVDEFKFANPYFESPERIFYLPHVSTDVRAKEMMRKHAHGHDIWGAGLCLLSLLSTYHEDLADMEDKFKLKIEEYVEYGVDDDSTFEDLKGKITADLEKLFVEFDDLLPDDIFAEELELIKGMLEPDPGKRLTGAQVLEKVSSLQLK